MLTPIAKSWPSEWCLEANSLAIQVHGGYGYTRDFPVEQYWRDNRLNMIHEGTHGIQGAGPAGPQGADARRRRPSSCWPRACKPRPSAALLHQAWPSTARQLQMALQTLGSATRAAWVHGQPDEALANATPYLQAFGHVVLAWLWLDVACVCCARLGDGAGRRSRASRQAGGHALLLRLRTAQDRRLAAGVAARQAVCREMHDDWF